MPALPASESVPPHRRFWQLPGQCAVCRGWGAGRLCADCLQRFVVRTPRCARCALRMPAGVPVCGQCLRDPPGFDSALAAVDYDHPFDGLITQFKFHAALDLAGGLARLLSDAHRQAGLTPPDLLLPVPLGALRLRERGFNQSWELARRTGKSLGLRAEARLLLRVRDTRHQIALPPGQRAANVRGAFAVEPLRAGELRGRSVAVVDDVMTTGATAGELARVLRQAGAARVELWVVARTPAPDD